MKKKILRVPIRTFAVVVIALLLICWDIVTTGLMDVNKTSYRLESEFDAITAPTTPVNVAVVTSDYTGLANPVSRSTKPSYEQIKGMVSKAIELQGGFDGVIAAGNTVMLKVNLVGGSSTSGQGENTDVSVVKALIETIHDFQSDVKIQIAEGTARNNDDFNVSGSVWHNGGYVALLNDADIKAKNIDVSLVNLNQTIGDLMEIDLGNKEGTASPHNFKYHVHKKEREADVYISVPVLKVHTPGITAGLKNQIGTAPGCYYGYNKEKGKEKDGKSTPSVLVHGKDGVREWAEEEIVDLSSVAGIDFVVIDAIMCLQVSKSYRSENQLRMNTIIAGYDPVAVDHVCTKLFGLNPDDIGHIVLAEKIGMGYNNPEYIQVVGTPVADAMKKVKKSPGEGLYGRSNRTWLLSPAYTGTNITEEFITNEKDYIPEALKDGWSEPVYFFDDQIDLYSFYDGKTGIVSYAFTKFYSPAATTAELWLGNEEAIYVYLNGSLDYSYTSTRNYGDGDYGYKVATINLKEGENTLLVKTLNNIGNYTFALNICEVESNSYYKGNRLPGLKFYMDTFTPPDPTDPPVPPVVNALADIASSEISLTNYPNPFADFTSLKFTLPESDIATINVYDLGGKLIENLANDFYSAGNHEITWNASDMRSGHYICTMQAGEYSISTRLLVK